MMARIRTIKPEFWKHEELSALPEATHMLAAALLNYADDDGYFNANPKLIQAECCPLREPSVSVHDSLINLATIGWIALGTGSDGKRYGRIVKFSEHQRINRKTESKIKIVEIAWDASPTTHPQLTEPSLPEGKGRERKGREENAAPNGAQDFDSEAELYRRGKAVLGSKAGGIVNKLVEVQGGVTAARAVVETASNKGDPREYVAAVIRNAERRSKADREAEEAAYRGLL